MDTERQNFPEQPNSRETESRTILLNSIRNAYGSAFSELYFSLTQDGGIEPHSQEYEDIMLERSRLALSTDFITDLLRLPSTQKRHIITRSIIQDSRKPFSDQNLTGKVYFYAKAITINGEILPLETTSIDVDLPLGIEDLEKDLAELIAKKDSLPDNLKQQLLDDPSQLPYIIRIYKHCKQLSSLDNSVKSPISKTFIWRYSMFNPKGVDNFPLPWLDSNETIVKGEPPPIELGQIAQSDRIMIVGSRSEVNALLGVVDKSQIEEDNNPITICADLDTFWQRFFDCDDYLDEIDRRNIPKQIFTTGNIRGYGQGGYTTDILETLERLSEKYEIELVKLKSFAL